MDILRNSHPQLAAIGQLLGRSMHRHVVENDAVKSAFEELAFELALAEQINAPAVLAGLLEPTT